MASKSTVYDELQKIAKRLTGRGAVTSRPMYTGGQVGGTTIPSLTFPAYAEKANIASTIETRVGDFLSKTALTQIERVAGKEGKAIASDWAANKMPTMEQFLTANPTERLKYLDSKDTWSVKGQAVRAGQVEALKNELAIHAGVQFQAIKLQAERDDYSVTEFNQQIDTVVDGWSSALREIDPDASNALKATLASTGYSALTAYTNKKITRSYDQKQAAQSVDGQNSIENIAETLDRVIEQNINGIKISDEYGGEPVLVDMNEALDTEKKVALKRLNLLSGSEQIKWMQDWDKEVLQAKGNILTGWLSRESDSTLNQSKLINQFDAEKATDDYSSIKDPTMRAVWLSLDEEERQTIRKSLRDIRDNAVDDDAKELVAKQENPETKADVARLNTEHNASALAGDKERMIELRKETQAKEKDNEAYSETLEMMMKKELDWDQTDKVFFTEYFPDGSVSRHPDEVKIDVLEAMMDGELTQDDLTDMYNKGLMSGAMHTEYAKNLTTSQDKSFTSMKAYIRTRLGIADNVFLSSLKANDYERYNEALAHFSAWYFDVFDQGADPRIMNNKTIREKAEEAIRMVDKKYSVKMQVSVLFSELTNNDLFERDSDALNRFLKLNPGLDYKLKQGQTSPGLGDILLDENNTHKFIRWVEGNLREMNPNDLPDNFKRLSEDQRRKTIDAVLGQLKKWEELKGWKTYVTGVMISD